MNNLINYLVEKIDSIAGIVKAYSPEIPIEADNLVCGVSIVGSNLVDNTLCGEIKGRSITVNVVLRGNKNDIETLDIAEEIFTLFNNTMTDEIVSLVCENPVYTGLDNNKRLVYTISVTAII